MGKLFWRLLFNSVLKPAWSFIEPIVELCIYLLIAYLISLVLKVSITVSITIVFVYFTLNLTRTFLTIIRDKT